MKRIDKIKQIGNIFLSQSNSQAGRVYDKYGICPTLDCSNGGGGIGNPKLSLPMRRTDKIVKVGYVWSSRHNGIVLDSCGLSPCLCVGQHSGVEPKIRIIYETD